MSVEPAGRTNPTSWDLGRPRLFAHRSGVGAGRQIRIEETERVRRLDHAYAGGALLLHNLIVKRLHARPMDLRPEVMLRVVAVVEPGPVVEFVIGAHTPGERLVRISTIVPVIPVQVGKTVAEIVKGQKKTNSDLDNSDTNQKAISNAARVQAFPNQARISNTARMQNFTHKGNTSNQDRIKNRLKVQK